MIYTLCGSQGVGKTTIYCQLQNFKMDFVGSASRKAYNLGMAVNQESTENSQLYIFNKMLVNLIEYIYLKRAVLFERSLLDSYAYTTYAYSNLDLQFKIYKYISDITDRYISYYDHIFYIPIEFELKEQKGRSMDVKYQCSIDNIIRDYLKNHARPDKWSVIKGDVATRLEQVRKTIGVLA